MPYYYEDLKGTLVVGTTKRETGALTYTILSILQGRDDASLSVLDVV
jgi:hypothetical protein